MFNRYKNKDCLMTLPGGTREKPYLLKWQMITQRCCEQICVGEMPSAGRCQTGLRQRNAGLFGGSGRLSLVVSRRAISRPLVERLGAVSLASDNSVRDIVFTGKILLTPATRSDNTPDVSIWIFGFSVLTVHKQFLMAVGILSRDHATKC